MPEPEDLRSHARPPAPQQVLASVIRSGTHRRRTAAAGLGGTALATVVAVVLGLAMLGSPGESRLLPADEPVPITPSATSTPSATPTPQPVAQRAGTRTQALPASATSPPSEHTAAQAEGTEHSSRSAFGSDEAPGPGAPLTRRRAKVDCPLHEIEGPTLPRGAGSARCERDRADVDPGANGPVGLRFRACNLNSEIEREFHFQGQQELALSVRDGAGQRVWTWRPPRPYGQKPHTESLRRDECFYWSTTWDLRYDNGTPAPPGTYTLYVDLLDTPVSTSKREFVA